jgi:hypothetical protein
VPAGSWRAIWLVALAIAVGLTALCEIEARRHHQRPSVVDDASSWAVLRNQIDDDPKVVAFVGTSRTALGFSADAFAAAAPGSRGVQLGIDGMLPFTILNDIAQDEHFKGVVVLDFIERDVSTADVFHYPETQAYLDRAHAMWRAPGALANRYLAGWVQSWFAVLAIKGHRLLPAWFGRRAWPVPTWVAEDRHRISRADYSLAEAYALDRKINNRLMSVGSAPEPADHWLEITQRQLEPLFRQIRAHGGDVVVIHMPLSGKFAEVIEHKYPRPQYWDAFARLSSAHVWHFRDLPGMAALSCGDDMHLDQKDQGAYVRALVEAMRANHVLR